MQEATILLVEGQRAGQSSFAPALENSGYQVCVVHTGSAAFAWLDDSFPDLVVFESSSMRSSGVRTCRRLRTALQNIPFIHCRAEGVAEDKTAGADVYLEQPFTSRKLLNRIKNLLPAIEAREEMVRFGSIVLFLSKRAIDVNGRGERRLTPKLTQLLEEFMRHPNEIVTRRQLMQDVWKTDYIGDTRTLDVHIRWIREHIELDPSKPKLLRTVRGKGYILSI